MTRRTLAPAILSVALLFTAACSTSGGDDSSDTTAPATTAKVEEKTTTTEDTTETTEDTTETTEDDGGGDFGGMTRDEIVQAMADEFIQSDTLPGADEAAATCVAGAMVDIVGLEQLQDVGTGALSNIDEAAAKELAQAMTPCGFDLEQFFVDQMVEGGATATQADCVIDAVGLETIEEIFAAGMSGGDPGAAQDKVTAAIPGCR